MFWLGVWPQNLPFPWRIATPCNTIEIALVSDCSDHPFKPFSGHEIMIRTTAYCATLQCYVDVVTGEWWTCVWFSWLSTRSSTVATFSSVGTCLNDVPLPRRPAELHSVRIFNTRFSPKNNVAICSKCDKMGSLMTGLLQISYISKSKRIFKIGQYLAHIRPVWKTSQQYNGVSIFRCLPRLAEKSNTAKKPGINSK